MAKTLFFAVAKVTLGSFICYLFLFWFRVADLEKESVHMPYLIVIGICLYLLLRYIFNFNLSNWEKVSPIGGIIGFVTILYCIVYPIQRRNFSKFPVIGIEYKYEFQDEEGAFSSASMPLIAFKNCENTVFSKNEVIYSLGGEPIEIVNCLYFEKSLNKKLAYYYAYNDFEPEEIEFANCKLRNAYFLFEGTSMVDGFEFKETINAGYGRKWKNALLFSIEHLLNLIILSFISVVIFWKKLNKDFI